MNYPKEFVERVKAEYPDWTELHKKLVAGDTFVGRYLNDSKYFGMSTSDIVKAFDEGREKDVKKAVEKCIRREKINGEWGDSTTSSSKSLAVCQTRHKKKPMRNIAKASYF